MKISMTKIYARARMQAALLALALVIAPFSAVAAGVRPGFNLFSPQQDYEIGRQSAQNVNRRLPLVNDSRAAMVNRIGRRLAAAAPGARFPYEFRVVNDSAINAFALPGGFVYVNRGALDAARSENEVAAVLAHEIAHVSLRHGTNQASKAYLAQAGLGLIGGVLGGRGGNVGQIIGAVGGFGLNTLFLKYSRSAESQADLLGTQIMQRAGYDPRGMISFLQTIQRHSGRRSVEFLSDHPNPENRIARLERSLRPSPRRR
ncbi:MAG TPA: M48 family metallopeptidase [Blastocatellia bacterium]|nr:M48 family metallopeptidase [Blastocatellia bacterium]